LHHHFDLKASLPQGRADSPTLFQLLIQDALEATHAWLQECQLGLPTSTTPGDLRLALVLYMDDILLFAEALSHMEVMCVRVINDLQEHGFKLNAANAGACQSSCASAPFPATPW
jgi:hypothetical protein